MVLDKSYPLHIEAQLMVEVELTESQCKPRSATDLNTICLEVIFTTELNQNRTTPIDPHLKVKTTEF